MSNLKQNSEEEGKMLNNDGNPNQIHFNDSMLDDFNFDNDKLDQIVSTVPKTDK
jgi:hypothetical protein